jgi:hypothetical protein
MSRDYKTTNHAYRSVDYQECDPMQKLIHAGGDSTRNANSIQYTPFSPIHQAPIVSLFGTAPTHPATRYPSHHSELWKQDQIGVSRDQPLDPLTKLRLLSASASSAHHTKPKTAVQENSTSEEGQFLFSSSAFTNFNFDRKAILANLNEP